MLQEHQAEIYSNWMKTLFIDHPVSLPGKQMDRQQSVPDRMTGRGPATPEG